ncbi:MAG: hypothetical protein KA965_01455 [Butyrivibrio sp.]|nr:hypothetical protein [Butyrivibrio sp.]
MIDLKAYPMSVRKSATMEALSYSVTLPDWKPLGFKCWTSDNGFVMQSHFGGHDKEGIMHDFYAYGFVGNKENGDIRATLCEENLQTYRRYLFDTPISA